MGKRSMNACKFTAGLCLIPLAYWHRWTCQAKDHCQYILWEGIACICGVNGKLLCNLANKNNIRRHKWQEAEALSHLMLMELLTLHEWKTTLQPTLEKVYPVISSSLVCEAVSQIPGQGKGFLAEGLHQEHGLMSAEILGRPKLQWGVK